MRNLQYILYGLIIGHWGLSIKRRLWPTNKDSGKFVVVALHSMSDDKIIVGYSHSELVAERVAEKIEEHSAGYIGIFYNLNIIDDREEFYSLKFTDEIDTHDRGLFDSIRRDLWRLGN